MRILLVANTLPPTDVSGVGEQVVQLASGLEADGHEVKILGRGEGGAGGAKVLFPLRIVRPFLRELRRWSPDVVQVHESDGAFAALAARWERRRRKLRLLLVALLQVSYVEEREAVRPLVDGDRVVGQPGAVERRFRRWKAPLQVLLGRWTARSCDLVLAPSEQTARELERDYGISRPRVLPNVTGGVERGPDIEPDEEGYLLFVGRLRIRKGVEILLEAIARLQSRTPLTELWIAGDGEHRQALEEHTAALGLEEQVRFLGRQSPQEVRGLLCRCRALVVPSLYEGMPLVILEAMERSVPIVASAVSGIPEVVRDRVTGWLVPPEDPEALRSALAEALDDPREADRRGERGREEVDLHYRPRHAAALWLKWVEGYRPAGGSDRP